jgi:LDH2 family malate/lactate/ureidoglycolate dehydrogenase
MAMNVVPTEFVRVMPDQLRGFVSEVFAKVGVPQEQAELLAQLLVATDLRGVFSHGTRQTVGYARLVREGKLNPRPQVRAVKEDASTAMLDGDGGLGHFASWRAAHMAVEKGKSGWGP